MIERMRGIAMDRLLRCRVLWVLLLTACNPSSNQQGSGIGSGSTGDQIEAQMRRYDAQLDKVDEQIARAEQQRKRLDAIYAKWEEQAERFGRLLDRWEKSLERIEASSRQPKNTLGATAP